MSGFQTDFFGQLTAALPYVFAVFAVVFVIKWLFGAFKKAGR